MTLEVHRAWKPSGLHGRVTVVTASAGAACGFHFERGREYLVYTRGASWPAHDASPQLSTDSCSRARLLENATEDLPYLELMPATMTVVGQVLDQEGDFVPGPGITLRGPGLPGGELSTTADSRGRFRLTAIHPGQYEVRVELWDEAPARSAHLALDGVATRLNLGIEMTAGASIEIEVVDQEYPDVAGPPTFRR